MKTSPPQRRRIPPNVWSAARAVYVADQSLSLPTLAERFGLPVHALKKRCSRGRWLRREAEKYTTVQNDPAASEPVVHDVPKLETAADFRLALQEEAKALLLLLRNARLAPGRDAVEVAKSITPLLGKLARFGEKAFAEPAEEKEERGCCVHPDVMFGVADGLFAQLRAERATDQPTAA